MAQEGVFQRSLRRGAAEGYSRPNVVDARDWFREESMKVVGYQRNQQRLIRENRSSLVPVLTRRSLGRMYMYFYDPKGKKELPYYDRFPLIFPFRMTQGGFYGLNMHYISPLLRARLMDAFYDLTNNNKYDETTKIKIRYNILEASARFKFFKPCVKQYLVKNVRSRFIEVDPKFWDIALFLPSERFVKAKKQTVFRESRKQIYGRK